MPAIITHFTFARKNIPNEYIDYKNELFLGTQGPDAFFYYGIDPLRKRENVKQVQEFGEYVHQNDFTEIYSKMVDYANGSLEGVREALLAYIEGLYMHYCVDRTFHPYIFYESGFDSKGLLKGFYKFSHGAFESLLDVKVGKKYSTFSLPFKLIRNNDPTMLKEISKMWYLCANNPTIHEDTFYLASKDYIHIEHLLSSHTGYKRACLFRFIGKYSLAMGMSYPHRLYRYKNIDVLNEKKRSWKHPVTGQEHNESIEDLFNQANELYQQFRKVFNIKDDSRIDKIRALFNGTNHDGCPINSIKVYSQLCWDREPKLKYIDPMKENIVT